MPPPTKNTGGRTSFPTYSRREGEAVQMLPPAEVGKQRKGDVGQKGMALTIQHPADSITAMHKLEKSHQLGHGHCQGPWGPPWVAAQPQH